MLIVESIISINSKLYQDVSVTNDEHFNSETMIYNSAQITNVVIFQRQEIMV